MAAGPAKDVGEIDFAQRLWDRLPQVYERSRDSKHTARFMAEFYEQVANLYEAFGKGLVKAAQNSQFVNEKESLTLQHAWTSVRSQTLSMGNALCDHAKFLREHVESPLTRVRKQLSETKARLEEINERSEKMLKTATERVASLKQKLQRAQQGSKAREIQQLAQELQEAQTELFKTQNARNKGVTDALREFQESELLRVEEIQSVLATAQQSPVNLFKDLAQSFSPALEAIRAIDKVGDIEEFQRAAQSGRPCPWLVPSSPRQQQPPPVASPAQAEEGKQREGEAISTLRSPELVEGKEGAALAASAPAPSPSPSPSPAGAFAQLHSAHGTALGGSGGGGGAAGGHGGAPGPASMGQLGQRLHVLSILNPAPGEAAWDETVQRWMSAIGWQCGREMWEFLAYEALLLATDFLREGGKHDRETAEDVMRLRLQLTKADWQRLVACLQQPKQAMALENKDPVALSYRLVLGTSVTSVQLPSVVSHVAWCEAQLGLFFTGVAGHLAQRPSWPCVDGREEVERTKCPLIWSDMAGARAEGRLSFQAAVNDLGAAFQRIKDAVVRDRSALAAAVASVRASLACVAEASFQRLPPRIDECLYEALMRFVQQQQLRTGAEEEEEDDDDEDDEDDDDEEEDEAEAENDEEDQKRAEVRKAGPKAAAAVAAAAAAAAAAPKRSAPKEGAATRRRGNDAPRGSRVLGLGLALHIGWREIAAELLLCSPLFGVERSLHYALLLRKVVDVVNDAARCRRRAATDLLSDELALTRALQFSVDHMRQTVGAADQVLDAGGHALRAQCVSASAVAVSQWLHDMFLAAPGVAAALLEAYVALAGWSGTAEAARGAQIVQCLQSSAQRYFKRLRRGSPSEWTVEQWKHFGDSMVAAVDGLVDSYFPPLQRAATGSLSTHPADYVLVVLSALFASEVNAFFGVRMSLEKLVDRVALEAIDATKRVTRCFRTHEAALSARGLELLRANTVDLAGICNTLVDNLLRKQQGKLRDVVRRCLEVDEWRPIGPSHPFSTSAVDFMQLLTTLATSLFTNLERMAPFGCERFPAVVELINASIEDYGRSVAEGCGRVEDVHVNHVSHDREHRKYFVPRQADEAGAEESALKGRMQKWFRDRVKRSESGAGGGGGAGAAGGGSESKRRSLLDMTLAGLCVRLSCLQFASEKVAALSQELITQWTTIQHREEQARASSPARAQEPRLAPAASNPLQRAQDALEAFAVHLYHVLAARAVYVELHLPLTMGLYHPTVTAASRLRGGPLERALGVLLTTLVESVYERSFDAIARELFEELVFSFANVLLNAPDRVFAPGDKAAIEDDLVALQEFFDEVLDEAFVAQQTAFLARVIDAMGESSETLVTLADGTREVAGGDPLHASTIRKILRHRRDPAAIKFIKASAK